jgi:hypothetical protein
MNEEPPDPPEYYEPPYDPFTAIGAAANLAPNFGRNIFVACPTRDPIDEDDEPPLVTYSLDPDGRNYRYLDPVLPMPRGRITKLSKYWCRYAGHEPQVLPPGFKNYNFDGAVVALPSEVVDVVATQCSAMVAADVIATLPETATLNHLRVSALRAANQFASASRGVLKDCPPPAGDLLNTPYYNAFSQSGLPHILARVVLNRCRLQDRDDKLDANHVPPRLLDAFGWVEGDVPTLIRLYFSYPMLSSAISLFFSLSAVLWLVFGNPTYWTSPFLRPFFLSATLYGLVHHAVLDFVQATLDTYFLLPLLLALLVKLHARYYREPDRQFWYFVALCCVLVSALWRFLTTGLFVDAAAPPDWVRYYFEALEAYTHEFLRQFCSTIKFAHDSGSRSQLEDEAFQCTASYIWHYYSAIHSVILYLWVVTNMAWIYLLSLGTTAYAMFMYYRYGVISVALSGAALGVFAILSLWFTTMLLKVFFYRMLILGHMLMIEKAMAVYDAAAGHKESLQQKFMRNAPDVGFSRWVVRLTFLAGMFLILKYLRWLNLDPTPNFGGGLSSPVRDILQHLASFVASLSGELGALYALLASLISSSASAFGFSHEPQNRTSPPSDGYMFSSSTTSDSFSLSSVMFGLCPGRDGIAASIAELVLSTNSITMSCALEISNGEMSPAMAFLSSLKSSGNFSLETPPILSLRKILPRGTSSMLLHMCVWPSGPGCSNSRTYSPQTGICAAIFPLSAELHQPRWEPGQTTGWPVCTEVSSSKLTTNSGMLQSVLSSFNYASMSTHDLDSLPSVNIFIQPSTVSKGVPAAACPSHVEVWSPQVCQIPQ